MNQRKSDGNFFNKKRVHHPDAIHHWWSIIHDVLMNAKRNVTIAVTHVNTF